MGNVLGVFLVTLPVSSLRADIAEYRGTKVYVWPGKVSGDLESRKQQLAEQIAQYSRLAGSMRSAPRQPHDPFWTNRRRVVEGIQPRNCQGVRKILVDSYLPESVSGYFQYGNCGEGAVVAICLAKHYGFPKSDVLHCQNRYRNLFDEQGVPRIKHQFGVLRMGDTWCLLDRWNRFQGGLRLEPIIENGKHLRAEHDPERLLYHLTTPNGGNFFAGARVSEEIEAREPTLW